MNYVSPFNNAEVSFRVSPSLTPQSGIFLALSPFFPTPIILFCIKYYASLGKALRDLLS